MSDQTGPEDVRVTFAGSECKGFQAKDQVTIDGVSVDADRVGVVVGGRWVDISALIASNPDAREWTAAIVACAAGLEDPDEFCARRAREGATRALGRTTRAACEAVAEAMNGRAVLVCSLHPEHARRVIGDVARAVGARVEAPRGRRSLLVGERGRIDVARDRDAWDRDGRYDVQVLD